MAISVVMPALEIAQETGKLVAWLKKEGDAVRKGEPLLEIETDKAVVEVEASADGVLAGISGEIGTDIPVGQVIAWIVNPGDSAPLAALPPQQVLTIATEDVRPTMGVTPRPEERAVQISPKARRLAKDSGIDVNMVHGSGPGGEILASDIQALVDAKGDQALPAAAPMQTKKQSDTISSIGRLMAERTTRSWTTVPHFFVQRDVDATALNHARTILGPAIELSYGAKVTHTDLLVALVGRTLVRHPGINASWKDDGICVSTDVNVAIAIAVSDGVVAVVVTKADATPLGEISRQRKELTDRARTGRLRPSDIAGGTFTISNLGMFHVDSFSAIITQPQVAILAVGAIKDRVVAIDHVVGIRPMVSLTLSADHRVIDGAKAASFLNDLACALAEPEKWLA
jgi:pyruvate dehydrogenase E2 component (dihydrolipoamide acetyltransferase)